MTDLGLALQLADQADTLALHRFRATDLQVRSKPDLSPVTDADTAVEDALRSELARSRPEDGVHGEERADTGRTGPGRRWVLDPIDGTTNYARGMPVWATLIALTVADRPMLGVASAPALRRRWWAALGEGAWTRDEDGTVRAIAVSAVDRLEDAYLSTTDVGTFLDQGSTQQYLALARRCSVNRALGDFWQHCLVAEGTIDLGLDGEASAWDLAALRVIVEEAGGRLTDLDGRPRHDGGSGLSSNGLLHDAALALLRP